MLERPETISVRNKGIPLRDNGVFCNVRDLLRSNSYVVVSMTQQRQIKNLQFRNPGPALDHFNPETSLRQERKIKRLLQQTHRTKRSLYDESGCLMSDGSDLCDCLMVSCPGCFYPCDTCRSPKCGTECRSLRRWHYASNEVEGGNIRMFPVQEVKQRPNSNT